MDLVVVERCSALTNKTIAAALDSCQVNSLYRPKPTRLRKDSQKCPLNVDIPEYFFFHSVI